MIKIPIKYIKYLNYNKTHIIKVEMLVRLGVQNDDFTLYKYAFSNTQQKARLNSLGMA